MSGHQIVRRYWRVVNVDNSGISYSIDQNERDALRRARSWLRPGYRLEEWEQSYFVSEATWKRLS